MNIETSSASVVISDVRDIPSQKMRLAWADLGEGLVSWRIWLLLSWQDIRLRYRRSLLGPFWITISMAITIYSMGFLYGHLFKTDLRAYYPFLAAGMLSWALINMLITDGTNTFVEAESYLKQMKLPYSIFLLRTICRNFIIFFHNIVVIVPILIIFHIGISLHLLALIPALLLIALNAFVYGMIFAIVGTRYRDIGQIILSLMQVAFFLTPIMWNANILPAHYQFVVKLNPFAQFIELMRAPLMGSLPSHYAIASTLAITLLGIVMALCLFSRVRHRIIYWL